MSSMNKFEHSFALIANFDEYMFNGIDYFKLLNIKSEFQLPGIFTVYIYYFLFFFLFLGIFVCSMHFDI